jgi:hypothetical protein
LPSTVVDRYHAHLFVRQTKILNFKINLISCYYAEWMCLVK